MLQYKNKEWLLERYINQKLSSVRIAKLCKCSDTTIRNWLKKHNIKIRTKSEACSGELHPFWKKKRPDMSRRFIGKNNPMYGRVVNKETRKKLSIAASGRKHTQETKEKIKQKLTGKPKSNEHKDKLSIAARKRFADKKNHPMYGKKNSWGKHTNAAKEKIAKRMKGKNNPMYNKCGPLNPMWGLKGKDHPAWIEPEKRKSTLYSQIRTCEQGVEWKNTVYRRDMYTCQKCGDNKGSNLNADHIKPLSVIVFENKITSLQEAIRCKELWSINNGRTLCVICHRATSTFGRPLKQLLEITNYV